MELPPVWSLLCASSVAMMGLVGSMALVSSGGVAAACPPLEACLTGPVIAEVLAFVALLGISVAAFLILRRQRWMVRHETKNLLGDRVWPAAVTRLDGKVILANDAMKTRFGASGVITERLSEAKTQTPAALYRLSRAAVRDGFAIASPDGDQTSADELIVAQRGSNDLLLWQIIPAVQFGLTEREPVEDNFQKAPFGYVRIVGVDGPATNELFDDVFAPEAVDILREQIDSGILTAGRILLPARDGTEKLALSAVRIDRSTEHEKSEIFLFLPDADTSGQVSAADMMETLPVPLLRLDIEGRVFWGNAPARRMLGDSFEIGRMLHQIVQPLGRSMDSLLSEIRSGRDVGSGEMMRLQDDRGDTFVQVALTHMIVNGQPSIMAVLTDASELRLLEDKFAQSQKMEAVGKLAGGVAHDFNNVLTAISGHCDLLLLRKDASHPDFSDLTQIRQNSNRAATLVRQLLAFSRKQTLQPRLLSVQDVVTDTLYLLDRLIGETITLSLEHGRDLGSVRADNQQLEQALMNLVVNARDAMPTGGSVTIATQNRRLEVEEKRTGVVVPPGDYVEISVMDDGTGIDPQIIGKVFDPFFTTKPQGEGTGLGLSTVYGIVKQSGGYIYAYNIDGGGACFTILLPRAYPAQRDLPQVTGIPEIKRPDLTGQGAVMLVEDEAPVRSFASRALKLRGYRVIEAGSAEEAMELLREDADEVDVLVSDVVMPGMDGPTFAAKARELKPDLRVIFISGYAEDSFRRNLKDDDFLFLPKPFSLNELTAKVKLAMSGGETPTPPPAVEALREQA